MEQILASVRAFDGVLELAPSPGDGFPELAWGDHFFYYAPDGKLPERQQPYATIVTKNYSDDAGSDLDHPGRWRLHLHVGASRLADLVGAPPDAVPADVDYSEADRVLPHPVYAAQGWVAIVSPGERTFGLAVRLLREAHDHARRRTLRRSG